MTAWLKALCTALVVVAVFIALPLVLSVLVPVLVVGAITAILWFIGQLCKDDDVPPTDPPP